MSELMNVSNADMVSFKADSKESKIELYKAINSPDYRVSDMINKKIKVRDAICMNVAITDDTTGEVKDMFRSIIIDTDGKSYTAVSSGIYSSLQNLYKVFGTLHFDDGLEMTVIQVKTKRGSTLSLTF